MITKSDEDEGILFKLLQPELLTLDEIIGALQSRCITSNLSNYSRQELIELFNRVALPLPQRTYPESTYRGKKLALKQNRKTVEQGSNRISGLKTSITLQETSPRGKPSATVAVKPPSRLKPPINQAKYENKVIKLNSTSTPNNSDLRDVVIKDKRKDESSRVNSTISCSDQSDPNLTSRKHKRIKIDFSDSSEKSTPTPRVIRNKRSRDESPFIGKHKRVEI